MIGYLSNEGRKKAAWIFFFLFYFQFTAIALSRVSDYPLHEYNKVPLNIIKPVYNESDDYSSESGRKEKKIIVKENKKADFIKASSIKDKPDIGGPGQPEMGTFKSVGADNMVNLFTGDFSYSIPLLDVGGYPVNLFYSGGISMDQDPSWVGLGWNINPGTISRNMRGLPDDYNGAAADGDKIKKVQHIRPDYTVGANIALVPELGGSPKPVLPNAGIFWNNKRGLGMEVGANFRAELSMAGKNTTEKTPKNIDLGISLNSQSGLGLSAGADFNIFTKGKSLKDGLSTSIDFNSRTGLNALKIETEEIQYKNNNSYNKGNTISTTISFAKSSFTPSIRMPLTRLNGNLKIRLGSEVIILHQNVSLSGSFSQTFIADKDVEQIKPAYGYMYYEDADNNDNALLDFNRINDGTYTLKTPVISIPNYTYDIFTINGEGTGGTFRGYRGNMGYVRDNYTASKDGSLSLAFDAGTGNIFHGGVEIGGVYSKTEAGDWTTNNIFRNTVKFDHADNSYQNFYFKNPGEKAIIDKNYYLAAGEDRLVRPKLTETGAPLPTASNAFEQFDEARNLMSDLPLTVDNTKKKIRDKRTQIISYLTAEEAQRVGLDKEIISYDENVFNSLSCNGSFRTNIKRYDNGNTWYKRKSNHLSEIDVLEGDGKRYVFGIPVYALKQKDVNFSINANQGNAATQATSYSGVQNSPANTSGRDWHFQSEEMDGYAHSFLLTGILSPDYVDVKGDGITDDDLGTAVKFNYTRVNKIGTNSWVSQNWRTPYEENTAHYNEGLKTDNADDKAIYTYGEKELWYTHSIETKSMVATFTLSERHDAKRVKGENGGIENSYGQRKLEKIDLYTKAEFLKANPRPVKTVHFSYSYQLCGNVPNNDGYQESTDINQKKGKLTLESVWFSYNGDNRQVKNKYRFKYAADKNSISGNPDYNTTQTDRWGTYKNSSANTASLGNNDFPYTLQGAGNADKNNAYASAWNLEKILLPGGAVINVNYEADDYGFVQDKRAAQMTKIAGFGKNAVTVENKLYDFDAAKLSNPGNMDYNFVFFDVESPVASKEEIMNKYLQGLNHILMKIWVKTPKDSYGDGYEPVMVYGTVKDYGTVASNPNRFWVELKPSSTGGSQIMQTVIQFLKDQLPSKAYKGFDAGNTPVLRQVVTALAGLGASFFQALEGFEYNLKANGKCKVVDITKSFARLDNPFMKKYGGGHRVKSIIISDNWKKISDKQNQNPAPLDSYYGQEYDYTTTEVINGSTQTISSGVATYEPGIGNEENPFRDILQYSDKQPLGPTNVSNVELPVTETFFPSPVVGYSKVTVRSIHNKSNKNIKSGTGKQVTEFYTGREYPVVTDYTSFDGTSQVHYKPTGINKILFNQTKDFLTLSQGFRVILNDMNGKIKSQTAYGENDFQNPINTTIYHYKKRSTGNNTYRPDNNVSVVNGPEGKISTETVGKDIEIMNDMRDHTAETHSAQIPLNTEIFAAGVFPVVLFNIFRATFKDESIYRSATTLKIINEYGILESVENIDKGSVVNTENLVYDSETGEALITKTNNEFNKPVYNLTYPAHWVNTGMDLAYKNIDVNYHGVNFLNGIAKNLSAEDLKNFESGDEIYVKGEGGTVPNDPGCIQGGDPATITVSGEARVWAVDITKDDRNTEHKFIFLDREGKPFTAKNAYIRIIRSGKRNMVGASVGSTTSMEKPFVTVAGVERISVSNTTKVLNAGAIEFKEKWRGQDGFYVQTGPVTTTRYVPVQFANITTVTGYSLSKRKGACSNCSYYYQHFSPVDYFFARNKSYGTSSSNSRMENKTWLLFGMTTNFAGSEIIEAKLNLYTHNVPDHDFRYNSSDGGVGNASHGPGNTQTATNGDNNFSINRLLTQWPSNSSQFEGLYNSQAAGYYNQVFVAGPNQSMSNIDYSRSNAIDITGVFKGMVADYYDPAKSYAPALKISMANETTQEHDSWLCFTGHLGFSAEDISIHTRQAYIGVKYFNCANALPVGSPEPAGEYRTCSVTENTTSCLSVFDKQQMNPYVYGLLGNWRPWKSYVYYGSRREKDFTNPTDIAKDGLIDNFENFWTPAVSPDGSLQKTGSTKWVWNSETTQYNRKGTEIENKDPLGRYNSGVYGYQETLPVAAANNARVREIAFDGFEDHNYKDQSCEPFCKPYKRHFDVGNVLPNISTAQHHTGKNSLAVAPNSAYIINNAVKADDPVTTPDIRLETLSTPYTQTTYTLTGPGSGLTGSYRNEPNITAPVVAIRGPEMPNLYFISTGNFAVPCAPVNVLPAGVSCKNMSVRWDGKIYVPESGTYYFSVPDAEDHVIVYIDGISVCNSTAAAPGGSNIITGVALSNTQTHVISVHFVQLTGVASAHLLWGRSAAGPFTPVPAANLYLPTQNPLVATGQITAYCVKPGKIGSLDHSLIDGFSLLPSKRYILSAWVKEGTTDCNCTDYTNSTIDIKADNVVIKADMKPTGNIIEGWQRYEFDFTLPANTQNVQLVLKNQSASQQSFFDDLRIHPYSSNLKSFVYNPENLRLSAELDENNYATFYEYDDEGTLVRVKKETKDGIKTITETRSALQKSVTDF